LSESSAIEAAVMSYSNQYQSNPYQQAPSQEAGYGYGEEVRVSSVSPAPATWFHSLQSGVLVQEDGANLASIVPNMQ
jgi:hypothetical protein